MKFLKPIILTLGLFALNTFAQEPVVETLPTASIDANYYVTLDLSVPLSEYYKVDITHLEFENETDAIKTLRFYVSGNLVSNQVYYDEGYMLLQIHTDYLGEDATSEQVQEYLGLLTKPE